jgi:membrane-associated phospholipid phosphatase
LCCASLVAISTLFTKQHYVADAIGGILLGVVANQVFLRSYSRANVSEVERRVAPWLALGVGGVVALGVGFFAVLYRLGVSL